MSPRQNIYGALLGLNTHACKACGFFTLVPALCYYHEKKAEGLVQHLTPHFCVKCNFMYLQLYLPKSYVELYYPPESELGRVEEDIQLAPGWGTETRIAVLLPMPVNWWHVLDDTFKSLDEKSALELFKNTQLQRNLLDLAKHQPQLIVSAEGGKKTILPHLAQHVKSQFEELANDEEQFQCLRCGGYLIRGCPKCGKDDWEAEVVSRLVMANDLLGKNFQTQDEALKAISENSKLVEKISKKINQVSGRSK